MSKYVDKAMELEAKGDLLGALNRYDMALDDPSCPWDIRCHMGIVHNKLRNFKEALSCFNTVLTMDENHFDSLFGKGIACLGLNMWDDSLDSFLKAVEINNNDANVYYYISIILQSQGDEKSQEYYSKFIELDNDDKDGEFERTRSLYNFGLIFLNSELELAKDDNIINLNAFKSSLKSFDLSDDEIEGYLKTLPYDNLISKINELNNAFFVENEKRIIRDQYLEMGFDDKDVDDYFVIDTIDDLKKDIISRTNTNPFPEKSKIYIPLYIENEKYIFEELFIEEKVSKQVKNKSKKIKEKTRAVESLYRRHYKVIKELISNKDFENARWYCDFIDGAMISNESFKVNFIYFRGLILSNLNSDLDNVLDDFNSLEKDYPEIASDKIYIHNKNNLENDLKKAFKR